MSSPPRLFFDVSFVASSTANTGIHRVVRHLLREMIDDPAWQLLPFCVSDSGTRILDRTEVNRNIFAPFGLLGEDELSDLASATFTDKFSRALQKIKSHSLHRLLPAVRTFIANAVPSHAWQKLILGARREKGSLAHLAFFLLAKVRAKARPVEPLKFCERLTAKDQVLFVDATWHVTRFSEIIQDMHDCGAQVNVVVHDVIPLQFPECVHPGLKIAFQAWFAQVARYSTRLICVSAAEAVNVRSALIANGFPAQAARVAHFNLASAQQLPGERRTVVTKKSRRQIAQIQALPAPCFLMVGTVEPRKNHAVALRAFTQFIEAGGVGSLLVIGAPGWNTELTQRQMAQPYSKSKPVLWLANADDEALEAAYARAHCVLQISICEGYGLPVAEAIARKKNLICSDLAVFHEIAGSYPLAYVPVSDAVALEGALRSAASSSSQATSANHAPNAFAALTWARSAREIGAILRAS